MKSSSHLDTPGHSLTDALMATDPVGADSEVAGMQPRRAPASLWQRLARNLSVVIGGLLILAIALVSLSGASLLAVVVAIAIPEIPRVVRLVRSIVLSIREEPYVEAAISVGTPTPKILYRHVLPNTIAPLIVQATYICASAILLEAILSFLGVGIPPETPTWGNIMAEGRGVFQLLPHNILIPGVFLTITVLAVNMLGDGLRDTLDPRMTKKI